MRAGRIRWGLRALGVVLVVAVVGLAAAYVGAAVEAFAAVCVPRGATALGGLGRGAAIALIGLLAGPVLLTRVSALLGLQVTVLVAWFALWWGWLPGAAALPDDCFELGNQVELVESHVDAPLFALVSLALWIYGMLVLDGAIRIVGWLRRRRWARVRAPAGAR